ncbi:hypothetical protein ACTXG6_16305 [Pseudonocardia sp. Cha107L01]
MTNRDLQGEIQIRRARPLLFHLLGAARPPVDRLPAAASVTQQGVAIP